MGDCVKECRHTSDAGCIVPLLVLILAVLCCTPREKQSSPPTTTEVKQ